MELINGVGDNVVMRYLASIPICGSMCFAGQKEKPACSSRNQGQLWPLRANVDHADANRLFQSGELEMCSLEVWKYKWEHVSVNVRDLAKRSETSARAKNGGQ
jgi:hypothetical protein